METPHVFFVKEEDGNLYYGIDWKNEVVGFFSLVFNTSSVYISVIEVDEKYRGQKLGNFIVQFILDFILKFGFSNLWLFVDFDNEIAQHLYKKFGFVFDNYIGDYCYRMTCQLQNAKTF
jgi:ribosomal protein S18 acetylase RimI-like enzyme